METQETQDYSVSGLAEYAMRFMKRHSHVININKRVTKCYDSTIRSLQWKDQIAISNFINDVNGNLLLEDKITLGRMRTQKRSNLRILRVKRFEVEDQIKLLMGFKPE